MKIKNTSKSEAIIKEIGARLTKQRLNAGLTQAALAERADVSKRTIERIESGSSIQLATLIQVLAVFNLLDLLDGAIPLPKQATPELKTKKLTENKLSPPAPDEDSPVRKSRLWGYES